ncbi:hypothetical protein LP420_39120 [Massilia sp. B-10]|nr:hypothetical protein LP420_39120 [Massilia sp. B-10]UUZ54230.1 hypothetical protein LP419_38585 [Massilia sp. H-1]
MGAMVNKIFHLRVGFAGPAVHLRIFILLLTVGVAGCVLLPPKQSPESTADVFFNPDKVLGQEISVTGYLRYTFENRNLYPDKIHSEKSRDRSCLPVLIMLSEKNLLKVAGELDGANVVIEGTIENVAPPGMVAFFTCKPVGIKVKNIRRRN